MKLARRELLLHSEFYPQPLHIHHGSVVRINLSPSTKGLPFTVVSHCTGCCSQELFDIASNHV